MNNGGFIKFMRSDNARELMKRPGCFTLLAQIAQRAHRTGELSIHGLDTGEALIGDHGSIGLTQQQYRTSKKLLAKLRIATFRPTNRGTVAKLIDSTIFDINIAPGNDQANKRPTNGQRANNRQTTINKNGKKEKEIKNEKKIKELEDLKIKFLKKSAMPQPSYEEVQSYR